MKTSEKSRSADNQQVIKKINNDYFAGFVDGEGCFYVGFSKRIDLPIPWQIITEFHVSQNPGSRAVLEAFKKRLRCGYLKPNHAKSIRDRTWILIVKNRKDLLSRVVPFFEQHNLHSAKQHDFVIFKEVLRIIEKKQHLSRDGFLKIVNLVFSTTRQTRKRYTKDILLSF